MNDGNREASRPSGETSVFAGSGFSITVLECNFSNQALGDGFREGKTRWNWDPGPSSLFFSPLLSEPLFGSDPDAPHEDDFEVLDPTLDPDGFQLDPEFDPAHVPGEEPIEPLADDWEPYEPRPEDLEELSRWSEGLDRDYVEAMERADVLEAIDRERWEPDSRIAAGAVD